MGFHKYLKSISGLLGEVGITEMWSHDKSTSYTLHVLSFICVTKVFRKQQTIRSTFDEVYISWEIDFSCVMGNQATVFSREDDDGMLFSSMEGRVSKTFGRVCFLKVLGFKKFQLEPFLIQKTKMDHKNNKGIISSSSWKWHCAKC